VKVSVVIVSYNVKDLLLACLRSVYAVNAGLELEVIVVDNNSSDGSADAVKNEYPNIKLIRNDFNAGFSGANNQGMKEAKGEYIFLLNPDTEMKGPGLAPILQYMEDHQDTVILGPKLLNSDGTHQISVTKRPGPVDVILETFFLHHLFSNTAVDPSEPTEVDVLFGAALLFRKNLIDKIGYMNEELFWMEDVDLCRKAAREGKIIYYPNVEIIHHSGQSQKKNYNKAIANQILSKLKYYRANSSFAGFCIAVFFSAVMIISRMIAFTLLLPFSDVYKLKSRAYFYTFKRYLAYVFNGDKRIA
jgi:GT2 family glycosyltransferase